MTGCDDSHYIILIFLYYLHFEKLTIDGLGLILALLFLYGFAKEWYLVPFSILKTLLEVFDQKQNDFV